MMKVLIIWIFMFTFVLILIVGPQFVGQITHDKSLIKDVGLLAHTGYLRPIGFSLVAGLIITAVVLFGSKYLPK